MIALTDVVTDVTTNYYFRIDCPTESLVDLEGSRPQVGLVDSVFWEKCLRLIVADRRMDNHVFTLLPVDGRGHTVLVTNLERVNDTNNFVKVATGRCWISNQETDGLLGINNENCSDGERKTLGVTIGSVLLVKHVVQSRNFTILVRNDGEINRCRSELRTPLLDILRPFGMVLEAVRRNTDDLDVSGSKVGSSPGDLRKFRGAHGREITWMGEQNGP